MFGQKEKAILIIIGHIWLDKCACQFINLYRRLESETSGIWSPGNNRLLHAFNEKCAVMFRELGKRLIKERPPTYVKAWNMCLHGLDFAHMRAHGRQGRGEFARGVFYIHLKIWVKSDCQPAMLWETGRHLWHHDTNSGHVT